MAYSADVPEPVQERAKDSARRILDATRHLLETRDYDEISLSEIALEADVSHGTLYARYRTKRALLNEVHEVYCDSVRAEVGRVIAALESAEGDPKARLEEGVLIFVQHVIRNRRAVRNFWRAGSSDPAFWRRQQALDREQLQRVIDAVQKYFPGAGGAGGEQAGRTIVALVRDIVDTQSPLGNDRDVDLERVTVQVMELLLTLVSENAAN